MVWAPNIKGQHILANIEDVVSTLRNIKKAGGIKDDIVEALQLIG